MYEGELSDTQKKEIEDRKQQETKRERYVVEMSTGTMFVIKKEDHKLLIRSLAEGKNEFITFTKATLSLSGVVSVWRNDDAEYASDVIRAY